ncbi:MAG: DUF6456 domain-containing protein [Dichotomicrobium sp.]
MTRTDALSPDVMKLLKTLSRRDTCLVPQTGDNKLETGGEYFIVAQGAKGTGKKPRRVSFGLVRQLQIHQLIAPNGGGFVLSDTGRAFLRRKLAQNDGFRKQHQQRSVETVEIEGVRKPAVIDETESPLGWLRRRKDRNGQPLIDAAQFAAGERLRADFFHAGLSPRVTASWDGIPGNRPARRTGAGPSENLREHTLAARQRVNRTLAALGPDLADILVDVCCHLQGLEEAEKARGWPRRSAKLVLQIALRELARHYGLIESGADAGHDTSRRLVHWGAADYKPNM